MSTRPRKRPKPKPYIPPPPLRPEVAERFAELAKQTTAELLAAKQCTVCDFGEGLPKPLSRPGLTVCIICSAMLRDMCPPQRQRVVKDALWGTLDTQQWVIFRLPYLRNWLLSDDRTKEPKPILKGPFNE